VPVNRYAGSRLIRRFSTSMALIRTETRDPTSGGAVVSDSCSRALDAVDLDEGSKGNDLHHHAMQDASGGMPGDELLPGWQRDLGMRV
jgi:hypothetical protein